MQPTSSFDAVSHRRPETAERASSQWHCRGQEFDSPTLHFPPFVSWMPFSASLGTSPLLRRTRCEAHFCSTHTARSSTRGPRRRTGPQAAPLPPPQSPWSRVHLHPRRSRQAQGCLPRPLGKPREPLRVPPCSRPDGPRGSHRATGTEDRGRKPNPRRAVRPLPALVGEAPPQQVR